MTSPTSQELRKLQEPAYWLVFALPWPDSQWDAELAEAAYVLSPPLVPRSRVPENAEGVFAVAHFYLKENPGRRTVWFSDLTRWLAERDNSWQQVEVDWEAALQEIQELPTFGMFLQVSKRGYMFLLDGSPDGMTVTYPGGERERLTARERETVHAAFEDKITRDWAGYIEEMAARGKIHLH
ncbi:hypothetical protein ACFQ08_29240 [Streptosporangium algeriense]|uniref:Uncharacterized protein n=1 Tax=Streptosporangium algeriense TaxID=1682748 RepID=A0ABW3DXS2_9ACTN